MATEPATTQDAPTVDSRWWYVVAATPLVFVVTWILGIWFFGLALFSVGLGGGEPFLFGPFAIVAVFVALFVGLLVTAMLVLFPVAIYLDAEAVNRAGVGWQPDSVLYALVAAISAVATGFTLAIPLALYYLWQRHEHVGVP
ncbi:hypothetical protein [Halomicrococcus sp. NG-SE-24]|uniref:hypothetical protein n=1 Tax=Halomicrococcus sp. NG-SE-24 TaxID=3436928 RepID=UPI003D966E4D